MYVVIKPAGLTWEGEQYKYGDELPKNITSHPRFRILLSAGFIASAEEAAKRITSEKIPEKPTEIPIKRPRGRPRKVVEEIKRGPGRPRKIEVLEESKKKKGRPILRKK